MLRKTGKQKCKNPGVPSVDRGNWGWEYDSLFYRVLALREECYILWRVTPYMFISPTKMTIFFGTIRSTNDNVWTLLYFTLLQLMVKNQRMKTCKMSKVHARSREITIKPLRVRTTKTLWLPTWKTNYNAEKCASDVKKKMTRLKQNFEGEVSNMQLDKEDTLPKQLE